MDTTDLEVAEDIVDLCEALEPIHGYAQVYMCNLQTQISEAHKQITTEFKGRVAFAYHQQEQKKKGKKNVTQVIVLYPMPTKQDRQTETTRATTTT
eukprot:SAG11_NODE_12703_length_689_cov_2.500000_1_plen_96_part_00